MSGGRGRSALGTLWYDVTGGRVGGSRGESLKVWRVSDGALLQIAAGQGDDVWSVAASPDGRWIANASDDRTVKIWRVGLLRTTDELRRGRNLAVRQPLVKTPVE